MFFYLSKTFWFFIQPLNLSIFLLLVGLAALVIGWRRFSATVTILSAVVLTLSAWTSVGALMFHPLEDRFPRPALPARVDGIVVLGGGFEGAVNLARGGYDIKEGGDRFVEAAVLALRYPEAKVLVSGGTGAVLLDGEPDADTAIRFLGAFGIPRERLIIENRSRTTYENAVFSKEMANPQPGQTWLLVTSAFHMPRSVGLFRGAGFDVVPWPVDYRTSGQEGIGFFRDNALDALQVTNMALREWLGLIAYWLSGRIDSPLPGPG